MSSLIKIPWVSFVAASLTTSLYGRKTQGKVVGEDFRFARFMVASRYRFWITAVLEIVTILRAYLWPQKYDAASLYLTPTSAVGALLIMAGAYIRYRCYITMGAMFTMEVSIQKDHQLITHGPYGVVRHPAYMGVILVLIGYTLWDFSPGSFLRESSAGIGKTIAIVSWVTYTMPAIVMMALRVGQEDQLLKEEFGAEWNKWAKRVPYKLLPYIY